MGKVFIHVGYPRTASTFIQDKILAKSDEICFPHDEDLYLKMCSDPGLNLDKYKNMDKPVIFSCEDFAIGRFFEIWPQDGLSNPIRNAERLHGHFPDATIIMVIRPQQAWIRSWWQFNVLRCVGHYHSTLTFPQIVETQFFREKIYPYLRYSDMLKRYRELFGKDNVKVMFLRELSQSPETFAKEFCDTIGITVPQLDFSKYNASKSYLFTMMRMYMNRAYHSVRKEKFDDAYFKFTKHYVGRLDFLVRRLPSRGLAKEQLEGVKEMFKDNNQELAELLNTDLTKYGF